ncbi:MAG: isopenicillin N synthase family oxygenase [Flammeovirgaceae bacterium]|nr:isopenicillin N synthase family oxygenase [Flammeovirgaceae bacterium]
MDQKKGIEALNQDFKKYEQVKKDQAYHLSEHADVEQFDAEYVIKTCDMRLFFEGGEEGKKKFALQLGEAMEGIGFTILTGHGIKAELYDQAEKKIQEFFETTTREERMKYHARRHGSVNQGYFPMKETTIIHPDLVEGWVFCRRAFNFNNDPAFDESAYWPRTGYEPFFRNLCLQHEKLIKPIMQSIMRFYNNDPHGYDERMTGTNFGFRFNYYPPITQEDDASGAGRMLGHEDVDLFTILPAQSVDGLQVLNRENGKWIRLVAPKGSIIMNTGDYMQRITNDRMPSTTHRVSKPKEKLLYGKPRISFPMAVYVWEDEILEVLPNTGEPKYEPIRAEDFHTRITSKYYGDDYAKSK